MADITKPYPRQQDGWNEDILQRINELCENPEPGCDPLEPLPLTTYPHRWSKADIAAAQNKLKEICPDNTFPEMSTPQLWSNSDLLIPLEEAIDKGWCNCEPEQTVFDLGTYSASELSTARYPQEADGIIKSVTMCGTIFTQYNSPWHEYPSANDTIMDIYYAQKAIVSSKLTNYFPAARAVWVIEDNIEEIETDLAILEGELAALESQLEQANNLLTYLTSQRDIICGNNPGSPECADAQIAVEDQQAVVDDLGADISTKETEIAEKETELSVEQAKLAPLEAARDQIREDWDNAAQLAWTCLKNIEQRYPTDINLIRDTFPTLHESWGDWYEEHRSYVPPKWEVYTYNICTGNTAIRTGRFSPGGFPYITSGGQTLTELSNLELACKYTEFTVWHQCNCYAWQINPNDCCFGQPETEECGHYDVTLYWAYVFANPMARNPHCIDVHGDREAPFDYHFILYLTPGPE